MPRYEDGTLFWQISRAGASLTITTGKCGAKGRTTKKLLLSAGAAQSLHDDLVIAKVREGFELVEAEIQAPVRTGKARINVPAAPVVEIAHDDRIADLEERVAEAPDDQDTWLVLGDLLQRQGDPRGELVALQIAADRETTSNIRGRARTAFATYFAHHARELWGSLAKHVRDPHDAASPPLIWRNGFIWRAELASQGAAIGNHASPRPQTVGTLVQELLEHPSGRLLGELIVRADNEPDGPAVIDALTRCHPRALSELELFARAELDLEALWPNVPRLRRLGLSARTVRLGDLELPVIERLRLSSLGLSSVAMQTIVQTSMPKLQRLELRIGNRVSAPATFADIAPLVAREDLPHLTHLKIRNAPFAGAILRAIADGPLADQLQVLDLSHGTLTPRDIEVLETTKAKFRQLRELWVPQTGLFGDAIQALSGLANHVITDNRGALDDLESQLGAGWSPSQRYDEDDE